MRQYCVVCEREGLNGDCVECEGLGYIDYCDDTIESLLNLIDELKAEILFVEKLNDNSLVI